MYTFLKVVFVFKTVQTLWSHGEHIDLLQYQVDSNHHRLNQLECRLNRLERSMARGPTRVVDVTAVS